jgi:hypothetical protein
MKCSWMHVNIKIFSCFRMWNSCPNLSASFSYTLTKGRAIAQAVSSRLSTVAARTRAQDRSCGILWGTKWRWGLFSSSSSVSPANSHSTDYSTHHHHHQSSGAGTMCQIMADVRSGLSLTPPQKKTKRKKLTKWKQKKSWLYVLW